MKPTALPDFREGFHYRQLHPTREGKRRWRYVTTQGIRLRHDGITDGRVVSYHDATGKIWGKHDKFGTYIAEGYAWNGCSPKRWYPVLGWCGTPDFQCTILASLVHDIGYQFSRTEHFPYHKSDIDGLFRETIAMHGELDIAYIYHAAVVRCGRWTDAPRNGEFSTLS